MTDRAMASSSGLVLADGTAWPDDAIEVARIIDAWGVKGGIKVQPFSSDPQALFGTKKWFVRPAEPAAGVRRPTSTPAAPAAGGARATPRLAHPIVLTVKQAKAWHNKKIMVTNPETGQSVVVRIQDKIHPPKRLVR